jgi:hypothetical protein
MIGLFVEVSVRVPYLLICNSAALSIYYLTLRPKLSPLGYVLILGLRSSAVIAQLPTRMDREQALHLQYRWLTDGIY